MALTDSTRTIVNAYAYTPFGTIANQQESVVQPFKFVGQYGVMVEDNGWYYMRARYYDPAVGRFISEDPLGFDGGDVNLYAYSQNNPVMFIDPLGLCTEYNSGTLLRTLVPGQIAWDNAMTSFNQGDYTSAGLSIVEMLGEQVLTVLTLGESQAIAKSSKQTTDVAFNYVFGKGGLLNSNRYLRLGVGRKGGEKVFRASGQLVNKISKSGHIDFFKMGKL